MSKSEFMGKIGEKVDIGIENEITVPIYTGQESQDKNYLQDLATRNQHINHCSFVKRPS